MKKMFQKLFSKVIKKVIKKSVSDVVNNPVTTAEVPEGEPVTIPGDNAKKDIWKFVIQVLISILTALAAAIGTTSCVAH
jgi:hypothetical protein